MPSSFRYIGTDFCSASSRNLLRARIILSRPSSPILSIRALNLLSISFSILSRLFRFRGSSWVASYSFCFKIAFLRLASACRSRLIKGYFTPVSLSSAIILFIRASYCWAIFSMVSRALSSSHPRGKPEALASSVAEEGNSNRWLILCLNFRMPWEILWREDLGLTFQIF